MTKTKIVDNRNTMTFRTQFFVDFFNLPINIDTEYSLGNRSKMLFWHGLEKMVKNRIVIIAYA